MAFCGFGGEQPFAIFLSRFSKAASSSSQPSSRAASLNFAGWVVGDGLVFGFMSFTADDVVRLRDGWRGPITVGELPASVATVMGVTGIDLEAAGLASGPVNE